MVPKICPEEVAVTPRIGGQERPSPPETTDQSKAQTAEKGPGYGISQLFFSPGRGEPFICFKVTSDFILSFFASRMEFPVIV